MQDRRKALRVNESFPVRFKVSTNALGMSARSEDVSEDGLRIFAPQRLEPGLSLKLSFQLPNDKNLIMAIGEVMWQNERRDSFCPSVMGIRFLDISPDDRDRIKDFIISKISKGLDSANMYETSH